MKRVFAMILCFMMPLMAIAAAAADGSIAAQGTATVSAAPDMFTVMATITVNCPEVAQATADAAAVAEKVIHSLTELGILPEDISTATYYVYPDYDYSGEQTVLRGYEVNHGLNITCYDMTMLDTLVNTLTDCGIDRIADVSFGVKDQAPLYKEALSLAVSNAAVKADILAEAAGLKRGKAEDVEEMSTYSTYAAAAREYAATGMAKADNEESTGIMQNAITVTANVKVTFEAE